MTQETSVVLASFDYGILDEEKRNAVQQRTGEIKSCLVNVRRNTFEIGNHLLEVKELLEHGQWGDWLSAEFDWSERSAQNFMRIAQVFKNANFADLKINESALYILAAPSTPESAREEAIQAAQAGVVSNAKVKEIVDKHKAKAKRSKNQSKLSKSGLDKQLFAVWNDKYGIKEEKQDKFLENFQRGLIVEKSVGVWTLAIEHSVYCASSPLWFLNDPDGKRALETAASIIEERLFSSDAIKEYVQAEMSRPTKEIMVQERAVRYWWEVVPELDDFAGNHFRKLGVYERLCFSHLEGRVGDRPGGFNVSGDRRYEKKCMIPLGLLDRVFDDVEESKNDLYSIVEKELAFLMPPTLKLKREKVDWINETSPEDRMSKMNDCLDIAIKWRDKLLKSWEKVKGEIMASLEPALEGVFVQVSQSIDELKKILEENYVDEIGNQLELKEEIREKGKDILKDLYEITSSLREISFRR